jgi:hypothetical protein
MMDNDEAAGAKERTQMQQLNLGKRCQCFMVAMDNNGCVGICRRQWTTATAMAVNNDKGIRQWQQ